MHQRSASNSRRSSITIRQGIGTQTYAVLDYKTPGLLPENQLQNGNTMPAIGTQTSELMSNRIPKRKVYATPLLSRKTKLDMNLNQG